MTLANTDSAVRKASLTTALNIARLVDPEERASLNYILRLDECVPELAARVGGKAKGLGFLLSQQLPVPDGFVVTVDAYRDYIISAGLRERIDALTQNLATPQQFEAASAAIRALFRPEAMSGVLRAEIERAYRRLGDGSMVAVRSSATAEDAADASFAGQQDTYLHITGIDAVLEHVRRCWSSLFTPQALGYRQRFGIDDDGLAMAVVVQRMVPADTAGVLMSLDPANGDRSRVYIEAALGLGEGVVRGDVGIDRYWVDKKDRAVAKRQLGQKTSAHRYCAEAGAVRIVDVDPILSEAAALSDTEIELLSQLADRAEQAFGAPVDIEWAVARDAGDGQQLFLLQARPETVWSAKPAVADAQPEAWDPLHSLSPPHLHWTTSNVGEAIPGIPTPLTWSIWGPASEGSLRTGGWSIGALSGRERRVPSRVEDRFVRIFHGRPAVQANALALLGDRMPGSSGQEVVRDVLGRVPEDLTFQPTMRRYPIIAWRLPWSFIRSPAQVRRLAASIDAWWTASIARAPQLDYAAALALLHEAEQRLDDALALQSTVLFGSVTPLYSALAALVSRTGIGDTAVLSGSGGAEMEVVRDIWRAAHGEIDLSDVVRRHGFHGPGEGELSSRVWREDATPLRRMLADYAARSDATDPRTQAEARHKHREAMVRQIVAAVPVFERPVVRLLLALAAKRIPLRGVAKRSFLQSLDVCRACARRLGELLKAEGRIAAADDVFMFTLEELGAWPADARSLAQRRRARRALYAGLSVPSDWQGMPTPREAAAPSGEGKQLSGIGVSPGVVEGIARVLLEPNFEDVQPNEILVAPFTDPSWCSVMFISSALVVDIGGALSHAAIVARELGIPCVVNTRNGSRTLRTGDRLRVDGARGTVEILDSPA